MRQSIALVIIALVIGSLHAFPRGVPYDCTDGLDCGDIDATVVNGDSGQHEEPVPEGHQRNPNDCPPCPRIYLPVCGSDGAEVREFSNECMMEFANCMEYRAFTLLKSGTCD